MKKIQNRKQSRRPLQRVVRDTDTETKNMKTGIEIIAEERERQISVEGWSAHHDDEHELGEMSAAASCYIFMGYLLKNGMSFEVASMEAKRGWPWSDEWWKPSEDKTRNLVKGGALIAAEIDRLQRAAKCP